MAYVAVKGGENAIAQSIKLMDMCHVGNEVISIDSICENMPFLIDKIMSEAGLYAPRYAALALKQGRGSVEEAIFLLRAYRSTLRRDYYTIPLNTLDMRIFRRISATFKDISGGQILGPTFDYMHRLLDFDLMTQEREVEVFSQQKEDIVCRERVSKVFYEEGIMEKPELDEEAPFDVTSNLLTFPAKRSARLQTLSRSDDGFLGGIAYSMLRGYGTVHATVGELRSGEIAIAIEHPLHPEETITVGEIYTTEVECFAPGHVETEGEHDKLMLTSGYGLVFGRNESKAIAMSIVDSGLTSGDILLEEEFILTHGDCIEMSGFISHLKLPHYVSFGSNLDLVREGGKDND